MYLSIGWFLVSWWPHDNLHIHNGDEYGFHVTLIIAAGVLALSLVTMLRSVESCVEAGGVCAVGFREDLLSAKWGIEAKGQPPYFQRHQSLRYGFAEAGLPAATWKDTRVTCSQ